ncbi:MAG: hypothetical protein IJY20_00795 [Clostridia bacterium]|nr:hypothetical protein [Clostridia bacterium]
MKKKLLSLLLVLCMVLPMVPVGAIIATAAETPTTHTTKASENMPTFTTVGGSKLTFKGNWDWVGHYKDSWAQTVVCNTVRGGDSTWNNADLSNTEIFIGSADRTALWGPTTPVFRGNWHGEWGNTGAVSANWEWNGGIRYTAEYTGTITIDITKLSTKAPGLLGNGNYSARFAVLVNGNMVWPKNGNYVDKNDWFPATEADMLDEAKASEGYSNLKNIEVEKGDTIELLVKSGDGIWQCRGNVLDMTVTYTKIEKEPTEASKLVTGGENWPVYSGTSAPFTLASDFTDSWAVVKYDDGVVTKLNYNPTFATYGEWNQGILWLPRNNGTEVWNGDLARCNINGSAADFKTQGVGFSYTVPQNGTININSSFNVPSATDLGAVYYAIVKIAADGTEKVVYGDTANAAEEGVGMKYTTNGAKTEKAKNIDVNAGDQLVFLFRAKNMSTGWSSPDFCTGFRASIGYVSDMIDSSEIVSVYYTHPKTGNKVITQTTAGGTISLPSYPAGYPFFGWDINDDGEVDYKPGEKLTVGNTDIELKPVLTGDSDFSSCRPSYDEMNSVVSYYGGWQAGAYDKVGEKFLPYTTLNSDGLFCHYDEAWQTFGGLYNEKDPRFALSRNMGADGAFWAQLQYTAPTDGTISIELKNLLGIKNTTNDAEKAMPLGFKLAIFKNGEQIWPAGDEWFTYEAQASEIDLLNVINELYPGQFPLTETVNVGDTIEFRVEKGYDSSRMIQINPAITYTAFENAPKITATGVTVKETFTLNVYTHLNTTRTDYVATGLKIWTSLADAEAMADGYKALSAVSVEDNTAEDAMMSDVSEIYNITGISAWELSKTFYARTWVEYADGTIADGNVVEISVADYAQNAINATSTSSSLNRVATALLKYAIALDQYRGVDNGLTMPEELPVMPVIVPENVYSLTTLEGGEVTITGANLVLGETIDLVITFSSNLPARKLTVLMDDNAAFLTPQKLAAKETGVEGEYQVTVQIRTAEFSKPFYFKVMDQRGDVQSGVLTYSVESYVARKYEQDPFNTKLIELLDAMLVLCKTANAAR